MGTKLQAFLCSQARWASGSSAGPTINPLDQMALQPQADLEASVAPKKAVSRGNKFQAKGVFGENVYTKGFSKNLAISPRKLNDFVKVIRGMSIQDAIIQCQVSVKKAARMCEDAIVECRKKAIEDNGADPDRLKVEEMWVGKGQYLKRSRFHARGRTGVMFKYRSHLTVSRRGREWWRPLKGFWLKRVWLECVPVLVFALGNRRACSFF